MTLEEGKEILGGSYNFQGYWAKGRLVVISIVKDITEPYWGLGQVNIMTGSKGTKKKDLKKKNYWHDLVKG